MRRHKKWEVFLFAMVTVILLSLGIPIGVQAATSHDIGEGNVTCNGGEHVITGETYEHHVTIKGENPQVTISNVKIDLCNEDNDNKSPESAAIIVKDGCNAVLIVKGYNQLWGGNHTGAGANYGFAGIYIEKGASLTIKGEAGNTLIVYGGGDYGGSEQGAAAIGSGARGDMGDLTIEGDIEIKAYGAIEAAGIGSGRDTLAGNITIKGGTIYAKGGKYGAGIGAGNSVGAGDGGNAKSITITGGTITAVGGKQAAGIGGSDEGDVKGTIKITGGTITATGGNQGAGIGGGKEGYTSAIEITGGDITATGGQWAAGIGGGNAVAEGDGGDIGKIKITGGKIVATGGGTEGEGGAGIGGSDGGEVGSLRIEESAENSIDITAQGGKWGAGIGSSAQGITSHNIPSIYIKLKGGIITATGGAEGAGIGGGNTSAKKIEIYGTGTINATGDKQSCAIGAGECEDGGDIIIEGDYGVSDYSEIDLDDKRALKITATVKGESGAAIIGAADTSGGSITIKNADIALHDNSKSAKIWSAGIGNAQNHEMVGKSMGNITIENCKIVDHAGSSRDAASIGAGWSSAVKNITIKMTSFSGGSIGSTYNGNEVFKESSVGTITIEKSNIQASVHNGERAAIGSGQFCAVDKIIIKESNVTASTSSGAGIGTGGYASDAKGQALKWTGCECGNIEISESTVETTGGDGGAGIGGGWGTPVGSIKITDSTVTAKSLNPRNNEDGGAGIGGGHAESVGDITIKNSKVTAYGEKYSAAIGSSGYPTFATTMWNTTCNSIVIEDSSDVTAVAGYGGAAIGTGQGAQFGGNAVITINDSKVKATGGEHGAGIGAGSNGWAGGGGEASITISILGKSQVEAKGGNGAAGIGGGYDGGAKNISIDLEETVYDASGWKYYVKAIAGSGAAGIGAGGVYQKDGGFTQAGHHVDKVEISGGYVYAQGGDDDYGAGAGIGGGAHGGNIDKFRLNGGFVDAHAGSASNSSHKASDIGGGGDDITPLLKDGDAVINAGTVLGTFSDELELTINGGSVNFNTDSAKRSDGKKVYRTRMQTGEKYLNVKNLKTSVSGYGTEDVIADGDGKVYLYMPESASEKSSTAEYTVNGASRSYYGTTKNSGEEWMKMEGQLQFENPSSTPIVGVPFELSLKNGLLPEGTKITFSVSGSNIGIEGVDSSITPNAKVQLKATDWTEYTVTATTDDTFNNEMYWNCKGTYTGRVTMKQASIEITENLSKIYDGEDVQDPAVKYESNTDTVMYEYYDENENLMTYKPVNAGMYKVKAKIAATDKYTAAETEVTFTIAKRPVMIELSASEDGADATITGTVVGYVDGEIDGLGSIKFTVNGNDDEVISDVTSNYQAIQQVFNVSEGEYVVNAKLIYSTNYTSNVTTQTFNKNLAKRTITSPNKIECSYGDPTISLGNQITRSSTDAGDTQAYTYSIVDLGSNFNLGSNIENTASVDASGNVTINNAGIAIVKIELEATTTWDSAVAYTTIVVKRAPLTVTPYAFKEDSDASVTQATYGTLDQLQYGLNYNGFIEGDDATSEFIGSIQVARLNETLGVGNYILKVNKLPQEGGTYFLSRNYDITVAEAKVNVTPAELIIHADDKTSKYGIEPEYTYSFGNEDGASSLMPWDKPEDVITSVGLKDGKTYADFKVGEHSKAIVIKKGTSPNYAPVLAFAGKLTVEKGDLLLDIKVFSKIYDGEKVNANVTATPVVSEGISPDALESCKAEVTYYKVTEDGTREKLSAAPKTVGSYIVKATAENEQYNKVEEERSFRIYKAGVDVEIPTLEDMEMKSGLTLADQKLPAGWEWINPDKSLEAGHVAGYAVYTPDDTDNYHRAVRLLSFNVYEKAVTPETPDSDTGNGTDGSTSGNGTDGSASGNGTNGSTSGNGTNASGTGTGTNSKNTNGKTTDTKNIPASGDNTNVVIWTVLVIAAMGLIIAVIMINKKKH